MGDSKSKGWAIHGRSLLDSALDRAQKVLQVGSEAADVLVHLQGGVTGLGVAAVGMRMVNSVREHRARAPAEFFGAGWAPLPLGILESHAYRALLASEARFSEVPGLYNDTPAVIAQIDGVEVAFAVSARDGLTKGVTAQTQGCWIPEGDDAVAATSRLARAIWEGVKHHRADLLTHKSDGVTLVATADETLFPSPKGDEIYERMKLFLEAGHHRSLFVVGEPGVGKSAMLRYIAKLHGGLSLQVRLADLGQIPPGDLAQAVEILCPDVLVMQDFDRLVMSANRYDRDTNDSAAFLLDPVERINRAVPIFMASANFSESITKAMLRPERFDEVVLLEEVDPDLYVKLLPDAPDNVHKHLRRIKAPVAYVQELRKRAEVLGYPAAIAEIKVLMRRADRVVNLSKRKAQRRSSRGATLVGKSPRRKAGILETRAAREEKRAGRLIQDADKARLKADKIRAQAQEERKKAEAHEAAVKRAAKKGRKTK